MLKLAVRWMLLPLVFAAVFLSGCMTANPLAVANASTSEHQAEQRYAAVLLTYNALLSAATQFVETTTVDAAVRRPVQAAIAASGEIYRDGSRVYTDFVVARAQLASGESTTDKLNIATQHLEEWAAKLEGTFAALSKRR